MDAVTNHYIGAFPSIVNREYELVTLIFNDSLDVSFRSRIDGRQWRYLVNDLLSCKPDSVIKVVTSDVGEIQIVEIGDIRLRLTLTKIQADEAREYREMYPDETSKVYYHPQTGIGGK
jgi:hypothetical protein